MDAEPARELLPPYHERVCWKKRCIAASVLGGSVVIIIVAVAAYMSLGHLEDYVDSSGQTVKVRLFWVRHGLSCANVMDKCSKGPSQADELLPEVERALQSLPGYKYAALNQTFGLEGATAKEGDCRVEVIAPGLVPGQAGSKGAIVRVHDLYTDAALTDCSRRQSVQAGRSFMKWLQRKAIKVHFTGSSFLMRAFQTSYGMFREPCSNTTDVDCSAIFVGDKPSLTPVPYITERAPLGLTSFQQDNTPRSFDEQQQMIEKHHGKNITVNGTFAESWPRYAQQYEKFKAFLAVVLAPSTSKVLSRAASPMDVFRSALESALPEQMHPQDHGKPIRVPWDGGMYTTGEEFDKKEYTQLAAPEINFVVVGHQQMMSEYCLAPDYLPKPNNNAILEKLFILDFKPKQGLANLTITMRELRGKCSLVMDAPTKTDSWSNLATSDVTSCSIPFPVSDFLNLQDGVDPQNTTCVQNAPEIAFTIQPEFL